MPDLPQPAQHKLGGIRCLLTEAVAFTSFLLAPCWLPLSFPVAEEGVHGSVSSRVALEGLNLLQVDVGRHGSAQHKHWYNWGSASVHLKERIGPEPSPSFGERQMY